MAARTEADRNLDESPPSDPASERHIHDRILNAIVERRVPPGSKLPEHELASIFATTRSRVRKILGQLAQERMVVQIPNRGSFVARPNVEEAREVFEARRAIEDALIRAAVARCDTADIQRLREHVRAERRATRNHDRVATIRLSGDFHLLVAAAARNGTMADFLARLMARSSLIVALYERVSSADCSHEEHTAIVDALESGHADSAAALMAKHLSEIESRLNLSEESDDRIDLRKIFG